MARSNYLEVDYKKRLDEQYPEIYRTTKGRNKWQRTQ